MLLILKYILKINNTKIYFKNYINFYAARNYKNFKKILIYYLNY